jgi:hypothetical protein
MSGSLVSTHFILVDEGGEFNAATVKSEYLYARQQYRKKLIFITENLSEFV